MGQLAVKITKKIKQLHFDLVGFTDAEELTEDAKILLTRQREGSLSSFLGAEPDKRARPKEYFPQGESIIMVAEYYGHHVFKYDNQSNIGKIAGSGQGLDYHLYLGDRLEQLGHWLTQEVDQGNYLPKTVGFAYKTFVDSKPILERALARKSGLGFIGKNCTFMVPKRGSYFWLGGIVTNLPIATLGGLREEVDTHKEMCGLCDKCIKACPTGALTPYNLNPTKCVAQLTQNKGLIPTELRASMGSYVYGCDICQNVCPHNQQVSQTGENHTAQLNLLSILDLTNRQFKEKWSKTALGWRGKTVLQRNAIVALGNLQLQEAIPKLQQLLLKDERPVIRGMAAWALGRMDRKEVLPILIRAKGQETDEMVLAEIEAAFHEMQNNNKK